MMVSAKVKVAAGVVLAALALGIPAMYVVAAEQSPKVAASREPATDETIEVLDGAPSLDELAAAIEKHEVPLENLQVEGFELIVYRRGQSDVAWKKSPIASQGDAWFAGGFGGRGRIRYTSRVLPWEAGTSDYLESDMDIVFDGQSSYEIRHSSGIPGQAMRPTGVVTITGKRDTLLDLQSMEESAIETGIAFTAWYAPGQRAERLSQQLRKAAAGGGLQVSRIRADGVEMVRVMRGDGKATFASFCVDPQHGYALRREEGRILDRDGSVQVYSRKLITELVEAAPGVWYPTTAKLTNLERPAKEWVRHEWRARRVQLNRKDFDETVFVPEYTGQYRVHDMRPDEQATPPGPAAVLH